MGEEGSLVTLSNKEEGVRVEVSLRLSDSVGIKDGQRKPKHQVMTVLYYIYTLITFNR